MKRKLFKDFLEEIPKDKFYNYWLLHNIKDTAIYFNCSESTANKIIKYYNLSKPIENIVAIRKQSNLNKYGVEHSTQNKNVQLKRKNTCLNKYGAISNLCTKEFKKQSAITKLKKYGTETFNNPEKAKQTCLKKYGVDNASKLVSTKCKIADKAVERFEEKVTNEYVELYKDKNKSVKFITQNSTLTKQQLCERFNCSINSLYCWIYKNELQKYFGITAQSSSYEKEIIDILKNLGIKDIIKNDRTILNGKEIDIYLPNEKIGIEFNGTYWHSSICTLDRKYHQNKSKLAEEKGIRLIHIWEYEWNDRKQRDKIISLLKIALGKVDTKIYARNCVIRKITNSEAKKFNNDNHLQGHRNAQVTYGLFYKDKLVQLMSFSKTKYNKNNKSNNDWEIIRGCPGSNNITIGGTSKLFKHFVNEYKPNQVFSYCDFNKFDGHGYEKLGMKFIGYTEPDKKWLVNGKVINRNPKQYKKLNETAEAKLYGAGSKKYLIKFNKMEEN